MDILETIELYHPGSILLTRAGIELGFKIERIEAARLTLNDKEYIKPWKNRTLEDLRLLRFKQSSKTGGKLNPGNRTCTRARMGYK